MRTAARDASTRAAAALRSGFRSTASVTRAVSSGSPKLRIQFGTTAPLRCGPAQLPGIFARADSGMMSAPTGGCLIAQLANVRHAAAPRRSRLFMSAALVELENKPIQFRRDTNEDFANDVENLAVVRINGAAPARAGREEGVAVVGREKQSHCDALFRCRYWLRVRQITADRHLTLCRRP